MTFVIPPAAGQTASEPTGMVWNSSPGFIVPGTTSPAVFIFATLSGTLSAWTAGEPTNPLDAVLTADNSAAGAHYTGVEFATTPKGGFLYAANIGTGTIDVFDSSFKPANALLAGQFVDPAVPAGYTPFNIRLVDGSLVVTYAKMNASHSFVTPGPGLGYVAIFDTSGRLLQHLASAGELNAPWGIAKAPLGFGAFSQDLLIGDFGNGWVLAYGSNGRFHGLMRSRNGAIVTIPGLWTLTFGNALKSDPQLLYFTAGPDFGQQGLFGRLEPAAAH